MRTTLTAAFCKAAQPEAGADRTVFWDASLAGFGLVVTAKGARSYCVQYRANGQSRRLTLSNKLALADARRQAKKLLGSVSAGSDPLAERREQTRAAKAAATGTLEHIARRYIEREGAKIRTMDQRRAVFERAVFPKLGAMQIGAIRRGDIVRLLDEIEDKRGPVAADKALSFLTTLFNWWAVRSEDFRSPIVRRMARTNADERARDRTLTDAEIRALWRACEDGRPYSKLTRFWLLTGTRLSEAARMTWQELDGADWTIPGARHKTKRDFLLPLSKAAQEVLAGVPRIAGCAFPWTTDGKHPIGGFSRMKKRLDKAAGVSGYRIHDLRRTSRTLMTRAGVLPDHAERAISHVIRGRRAIYDRHDFYAEKAAAFEALAGMIERIVSG